MLSLANPRTLLDRSLLEAPGGFAWWYLDLVDEHGNGLVVIWSFGLPFLPGYAAADRLGQPQRPRERPSLNVSVYRDGQPDFYLLQEYPEDAVQWEEGSARCRFGRSQLVSWEEDGQRRVRLDLDAPLPDGSRLQGIVRAQGPLLSHRGDPAVDPRHQWTPLLTAATGTARLQLDGEPFCALDGRVYHDRNGSTHALHRLGIDHWIWGRVPAHAGERIYYLLWPQGGGEPQCWGLTVGEDGEVAGPFALSVRLGATRRSWYAFRWWQDLELLRDGVPWLSVSHWRVVDDGPFYMRYLTRAAVPGQDPRTGVGEAVRPDRVDLDWQRLFVRSAVHRIQGPNTFMVNFFIGAREGRWCRWAQQPLGTRPMLEQVS